MLQLGRISEEETKDVQKKLDKAFVTANGVGSKAQKHSEILSPAKAEEEVNKQIQELQETKRELRILENRDMIVSLGCF